MSSHAGDAAGIGGHDTPQEPHDPLRVISRRDLAALGYPRVVIDAIFQNVPNLAFPGSQRRLILRADLERYVQEHRFGGDRVR